MIYTTKKCSVCGCVIQSHESNRTRYGSPIRKCPGCKAVYFDQDYTEAALTADTTASRIFEFLGATIGTALLNLFLTSIVIFLLFGGNQDFYIFVYIVLQMILGFVIFYSVFVIKDNNIIIEKERSLERLKDSNYAKILFEHGYKVGKNSYYERYLENKNGDV